MSTNPGAYGSKLGPQISRVGGIIQTNYGVLIPPTTQVAAYVRADGPQDGDDVYMRDNMVTTLNEGLKRCRSGYGDIVFVLPDHTENVASADQMSSLVAGTKIIGLGAGNLRPTFTWTVAAATFLFDVANVGIDNCILNFTSATTAGVTRAAPITVSAAGCFITNCRITFGTDADDIITRGVTTTAAADDFNFSGNHCFGALAAEVEETFLELVGADRLVMHDCVIDGATDAAAVPLVRFITTKSLNIDVQRCVFVNRKAASDKAVLGMVANSGTVKDCHFGILDTVTLTGWTTEADVLFYNCSTSNTTGTSA
jgi:hypothetical protein